MRLLKQTLVCGLYTLYTSSTDDGTLLLQHRDNEYRDTAYRHIVFWRKTIVALYLLAL